VPRPELVVGEVPCDRPERTTKLTPPMIRVTSRYVRSESVRRGPTA
jgi:hypothetical protein